RPRLVATYAALTCAFFLTILTLNVNLNVRVAMFDARAPTSRALLAAADPALRLLERRAGDASAYKGLVRAARDTAGLPTQEGAHILLITIDALRADHLGLYGYKRPVSPGLDALAEKATVFER